MKHSQTFEDVDLQRFPQHFNCLYFTSEFDILGKSLVLYVENYSSWLIKRPSHSTSTSEHHLTPHGWAILKCYISGGSHLAQVYTRHLQSYTVTPQSPHVSLKSCNYFSYIFLLKITVESTSIALSGSAFHIMSTHCVSFHSSHH